MGVYECDHCNMVIERRVSQMKGKVNHFCTRACMNAERGGDGLIGKTRNQTCLELFGVPNAFQSPEKQVKAQQTMLRRYGVEHAMGVREARLKVINANIRRWRNTTDIDRQVMQNKRKATCIERYGVDHPMKSPTIAQRATQTMLDHGFLRSRGEKLLHAMLVELYTNNDVLTQVWQNNVAGRNHPVDLYVKSLRLLIEFDGNWHHSRDHIKQRDKEFDAWCVDKGRKLLRISEAELCVMLGCRTHRLPAARSNRSIETLISTQALSSLRMLVERAAALPQMVFSASDITTPQHHQPLPLR